MRFSEKFGIGANQESLDFVDVPLRNDIRLFLDPYAITVAGTTFAEECHEIVHDFFQQVLAKLRTKDESAALRMLSHLTEENRTRLGYSSGESNGSGLGPSTAKPFLDALTKSEAYKTGRIEDIEDAALFVNGIDKDIISDMLTDVLHEKLAQYTQSQCHLYGVPMTKSETLSCWRSGNGWSQIQVRLPSYKGLSILLVPRALVRANLLVEPTGYIRFIIDELDAGRITATGSLEKMLQTIPTKKNGKILRGKFKNKLDGVGSKKDAAFQLNSNFRQTLKEYKQQARKSYAVPSAELIEKLQPHPSVSKRVSLVDEVRNARANASEIIDSITPVTGLISKAFFPYLQNPRLLPETIDGFKPLLMSNTAVTGLLGNSRWSSANNLRNIVVLLTNLRIDKDIVDKIKNARIFSKENDTGLVLIVSPVLAPSVKADRARLALQHYCIIESSEIAQIADTSTEPDQAVQMLEKLLAA
jgi:hypothetical protein